MYLFDTDVISQVLRARPPIHLIRQLARVPAEHQFTTAITLGEIACGAYKAHRADLLERARAAVLTALVVLPFDSPAAERYGQTRADLERLGTPLAEPDLRIAAIAMTRDLTLVTGNTRHFSRIAGLRVEDWIAAPPRE
jgi:predicted nucleic acid-binding protein